MCSYLMLNFSCACNTQQPTWCLYVSTSCSDLAVQQPTWCLCVPTSCSILVVHVMCSNPHGTCVFIVGSSSSFFGSSSSASLLLYLLLLCDVQAPDEASVIGEAKARLPFEPASSDPNGCRIGEPFHHLSPLSQLKFHWLADLLLCVFQSIEGK